MKKDKLIKPGAYLILLLGILTVLALIIAIVAIFMAYPEASLVKKVGVSASIVILALVIGLITLAAFESMVEVVELEEEIDVLGHKEDTNGRAGHKS